MVTNSVRLDWIREDHYQLRDRNNFSIVMAPAPDGVTGADLLPLSLIGCFSWDVMEHLRAQGVQVAGLSTFADCQQVDEPPWQFQRISIRFQFRGRNLDRAAIQEAIGLIGEQYCSVFVTLKRAVEITTQVEILEAEPGI